MSPVRIDSRIQLTQGTDIPVLGLGVWQMDAEETERSVASALAAGYRLVDTATLYKNEESVGKAVRESNIAREAIFVTTKLWPTDALDARAAFEASLRRLGLSYVDLYLIHWPVPFLSSRIWKQLEALYDEKLVRAIGVSNYSISQLEEILRDASVPPAVHQIELNPFSYDKQMLAFCQAHDMVVEAYSPLTRGLHLDDPTIGKVAMQHSKTPAQIMLRWALQKGAVVIPKSSNTERIEENADIFNFELSDADMRRLDTLA